MCHKGSYKLGGKKKSGVGYLAMSVIMKAMEVLLDFKDYFAYLRVSKRLYKRSRVRRKLCLVLLEGGISVKARRKYWFAQCEINEIARKDPYRLSYYLSKECPYANDIAKDLDRTFPKHHLFYIKPEYKLRLNNILQAFAVKNPDIGYIQGLNFIAGHLILQFTDEVIV